MISDPHNAVTVAVLRGVLPRANDVPCAECGHQWTEGERRHEYHHHRGYAPESYLDVQALCTTCHKATRGAHAEGPTLCVRVPAELRDAVKAKAASEDRSMAQAIRLALRRYVGQADQ